MNVDNIEATYDIGYRIDENCNVSQFNSSDESWLSVINIDPINKKVYFKVLANQYDERTGYITATVNGHTCNQKRLTVVQAAGGGGSTCECGNVQYSPNKLTMEWAKDNMNYQTLTVTPPDGCETSNLTGSVTPELDVDQAIHFTAVTNHDNANEIIITPIGDKPTTHNFVNNLSVSFSINGNPCNDARDITLVWKDASPAPPQPAYMTLDVESALSPCGTAGGFYTGGTITCNNCSSYIDKSLLAISIPSDGYWLGCAFGDTTDLNTVTIYFRYSAADTARSTTVTFSYDGGQIGEPVTVSQAACDGSVCMCYNASLIGAGNSMYWEYGDVNVVKTSTLVATKESCQITNFTLTHNSDKFDVTFDANAKTISAKPKASIEPPTGEEPITDIIYYTYKIGDSFCNYSAIYLIWDVQGGTTFGCDDIYVESPSTLRWIYSDDSERAFLLRANTHKISLNNVTFNQPDHFNVICTNACGLANCYQIIISPKGEAPTTSAFHETLNFSYTVNNVTCTNGLSMDLIWEKDIVYCRDLDLWTPSSYAQQEKAYEEITNINYTSHEETFELCSNTYARDLEVCIYEAKPILTHFGNGHEGGATCCDPSGVQLNWYDPGVYNTLAKIQEKHGKPVEQGGDNCTCAHSGEYKVTGVDTQDLSLIAKYENMSTTSVPNYEITAGKMAENPEYTFWLTLDTRRVQDPETHEFGNDILFDKDEIISAAIGSIRYNVAENSGTYDSQTGTYFIASDRTALITVRPKAIMDNGSEGYCDNCNKQQNICSNVKETVIQHATNCYPPTSEYEYWSEYTTVGSSLDAHVTANIWNAKGYAWSDASFPVYSYNGMCSLNGEQYIDSVEIREVEYRQGDPIESRRVGNIITKQVGGETVEARYTIAGLEPGQSTTFTTIDDKYIYGISIDRSTSTKVYASIMSWQDACDAGYSPCPTGEQDAPSRDRCLILYSSKTYPSGPPCYNNQIYGGNSGGKYLIALFSQGGTNP